MARGGVGCFWPPFAAAPDGACARRQRVALAAASADLRLDRPSAQLLAQRLGVVAAVGPQLGRPQAAREEVIDEREQLEPLVLVAAPEPDGERGAVGVDG